MNEICIILENNEMNAFNRVLSVFKLFLPVRSGLVIRTQSTVLAIYISLKENEINIS